MFDHIRVYTNTTTDADGTFSWTVDLINDDPGCGSESGAGCGFRTRPLAAAAAEQWVRDQLLG